MNWAMHWTRQSRWPWAAPRMDDPPQPLRTELREPAEAQFKALNEVADALGCPRIRREMGSRQFALAAATIALKAAQEKAE